MFITVFIANTKLGHYPITISVTFDRTMFYIYEEKVNHYVKIELFNKNVVGQKFATVIVSESYNLVVEQVT